MRPLGLPCPSRRSATLKIRFVYFCGRNRPLSRKKTKKENPVTNEDWNITLMLPATWMDYSFVSQTNAPIRATDIWICNSKINHVTKSWRQWLDIIFALFHLSHSWSYQLACCYTKFHPFPTNLRRWINREIKLQRYLQWRPTDVSDSHFDGVP